MNGTATNVVTKNTTKGARLAFFVARAAEQAAQQLPFVTVAQQISFM